jgi:hypothetical protein
MLKTSWSEAQYHKYQQFKAEQQRQKEAELWQGASGDEEKKQPPKLQFKQRMYTTGPAAENTIVCTPTAG